MRTDPTHEPTRERAHLSVDKLASLVDELVRVARVAVHEAVSVGDTTVTEEDHELVSRLGVLRRVVPERVGVLEVRLRVALLGVDEVGELGRVTKEENGGVVLEGRVEHGLAESPRAGQAGQGSDIRRRGPSCPPRCGS